MRKKYAPHEPEEDVLSVARGTAQTDSDIDLLVSSR